MRNTTQKNTTLKITLTLTLTITISLQVSFYQWLNDFDTLKNTAQKYNTHEARLYNTIIQHVHHYQIQHKVHTACLYNTLIQHKNIRKMLTPSETCLFSVKKKTD